MNKLRRVLTLCEEVTPEKPNSLQDSPVSKKSKMHYDEKMMRASAAAVDQRKYLLSYNIETFQKKPKFRRSNSIRKKDHFTFDEHEIINMSMNLPINDVPFQSKYELYLSENDQSLEFEYASLTRKYPKVYNYLQQRNNKKFVIERSPKIKLYQANFGPLSKDKKDEAKMRVQTINNKHSLQNHQSKDNYKRLPKVHNYDKLISCHNNILLKTQLSKVNQEKLQNQLKQIYQQIIKTK